MTHFRKYKYQRDEQYKKYMLCAIERAKRLEEGNMDKFDEDQANYLM
jgi:hypothetical protein